MSHLIVWPRPAPPIRSAMPEHDAPDTRGGEDRVDGPRGAGNGSATKPARGFERSKPMVGGFGVPRGIPSPPGPRGPGGEGMPRSG